MQVHVYRSALRVCCLRYWRGQQGPGGRRTADRLTGISQWALLTSHPLMVFSLHAIHLLDHVWCQNFGLWTKTRQKLLILKGKKKALLYIYFLCLL